MGRVNESMTTGWVEVNEWLGWGQTNPDRSVCVEGGRMPF